MDELFFILSKLAWGVLSPTNMIILMMALGTLFLMKGAVSAAKKILVSTVVVTLLLTVYPLGDSVMFPLENRFSKPQVMPEQIDGIIVLGGGEQLKTSLSWQSAELGAGGDRYIGAAILAKRYPTAPVIFTGGNSLLSFQGKGDQGNIAQTVLTAVGIEKNRLIIESKSRNTNENFLFIRPLLPETMGNYLLVTSAFHMPRAMGIARQQGLNVIAYPVDYRSNQPVLRQWSFNLYEHLEVLEPAWREWIGLTVYYITGRTDEWFPAPVQAVSLQKSQGS
ncbi:MAG: YdcF family protein [Piscirickettsiaceae bacterium]|nr:YdcF family protein [Piscirickettsiaceae bacterium]